MWHAVTSVLGLGFGVGLEVAAIGLGYMWGGLGFGVGLEVAAWGRRGCLYTIYIP